jgi:hypothetical protein
MPAEMDVRTLVAAKVLGVKSFTVPVVMATGDIKLGCMDLDEAEAGVRLNIDDK